MPMIFSIYAVSCQSRFVVQNLGCRVRLISAPILLHSTHTTEGSRLTAHTAFHSCTVADTVRCSSKFSDPRWATVARRMDRDLAEMRWAFVVFVSTFFFFVYRSIEREFKCSTNEHLFFRHPVEIHSPRIHLKRRKSSSLKISFFSFSL